MLYLDQNKVESPLLGALLWGYNGNRCQRMLIISGLGALFQKRISESKSSLNLTLETLKNLFFEFAEIFGGFPLNALTEV